MSVSTKFVCLGKTQSTNNPMTGIVVLIAVMANGPENKGFSEILPSGHITLGLSDPAAFAQFEEGQEYYVDFTPVQEIP